jgi:hypothetical protein
MGRVIVFGPYVPGDDALENSRWVAQQHITQFSDVVEPIVDAHACRQTLEKALCDSRVEGIALCGHGDGGREVFLMHSQYHQQTEQWRQRHEETSSCGAVYGSDGERALDEENLHLFVNRWVHVVACEVGLSKLPERAQSLGVTAFVSYEQRLVPEFTVATLPDDAVAILGQIVTITTKLLCARLFDQDILVRETRQASEALDEWFDSEAGMAWAEGPGALERVGLTKFTKQLSSALRVALASGV